MFLKRARIKLMRPLRSEERKRMASGFLAIVLDIGADLKRFRKNFDKLEAKAMLSAIGGGGGQKKKLDELLSPQANGKPSFQQYFKLAAVDDLEYTFEYASVFEMMGMPNVPGIKQLDEINEKKAIEDVLRQCGLGRVRTSISIEVFERSPSVPASP